MCSGKGRQGITPARFPHSDIPGSKSACDSPRLNAACHVLHRLLVPRHPPHALTSLAKKFAPDRQHPAQPSRFLRDKKGSINAQQKIAGLFSCQRTGRPSASGGFNQQSISNVGLGTDFWFNPISRIRQGTVICYLLGGEYGARTRDLRLAKPALSQLS
jgi:hypothetical protein